MKHPKLQMKNLVKAQLGLKACTWVAIFRAVY